MFHTLIDSIPGTFGLLMCRKLLYSVVDMSANGGHGEVVSINQELVTDSLGYPVAACRHANGRDWWILVQRFASNCFYRVLLDSTGAHLLPDMTCVGPEYNQTSIANACFSPDGSRYAFYTTLNELNLYRFNRCEGVLYDAQNLYLTPTNDGVGFGASFSPNSRFLYASFTGRMCQFDLWESDIQNSIDTVGIYDGVYAPYILGFHTQQLGPDGKIYLSCGNSSFVYHVIERPDEKGDSCMFTQRGLWFPNFSVSIPTFPNYRLGALTGPCDTIINNTEKVEREKHINLYPNPATNYIIIDYGFTDWSRGDITLEVTNSIGQIMYKKQLPRYSGFHQVDVSQFASGLYTATIKRKGEVVATGRFVRE